MKIAIAGAGPAGLSAAIELASNGCQVTMYERGQTGEDIICAEGLFDFFGKFNSSFPLSLKIKEICLEDKETYNVTLPPRSNFITFERSLWQKQLSDTAVKCGVKIAENTKLLKDDILKLSMENDFVLDATGVKALSHFLFPRNEVKRYRLGLMPTFQYTLKGDFQSYAGKLKVIVFNDPPGYYWLFPKSNGMSVCTANAGLGFLSRDKNMPNLKTLLNEIIQKEGLSDCEIAAKKSSPIPVRRLKTYRAKNIILLGDALGLCSPLHGAGIDTAYLSGQFAAQSILKNDFSIYEDFLKETDNRFLKERLILFLWKHFKSFRVLSRLKGKGLFDDGPDNILFSDNWLRKAILRIFF